MINWFLKRIYKTEHGRKQLLKLAYQDQAVSKEEEFKKMVFSHIDGSGKKYFRYKDEFQMCIPRLEQLEIRLLEWNQRMEREELHEWLNAQQKLLAKAIKVPNNEPQVQRCIYMCEALRDRTEIFFDPELLIELMCVITIREDENPFEWNTELQEEKKKQIKEDIEGGMSDFFRKSGLKRFIPSLNDLTKGIKRSIPLLKAQKAKFREMNSKILQRIGV